MLSLLLDLRQKNIQQKEEILKLLAVIGMEEMEMM